MKIEHKCKCGRLFWHEEKIAGFNWRIQWHDSQPQIVAYSCCPWCGWFLHRAGCAYEMVRKDSVAETEARLAAATDIASTLISDIDWYIDQRIALAKELASTGRQHGVPVEANPEIKRLADILYPRDLADEGSDNETPPD